MADPIQAIVFSAARPPRAKPRHAGLAAKQKKATTTEPKQNQKKKKRTAKPPRGTPAAVVLAAHANSTERVQSRLYNLTLDVNNLKQQVASLATYRSILFARALVAQHDLDGSILKKVHAYFGAFRRGFVAGDRKPAALIGAIADEDLSLGVTGFGRDMLLEQWRRYTEYFGMRRCDVPAPRLLPGSSEHDDHEDSPGATIAVRAGLTFEGSFTPTALAIVFPAVLRDPELTQELLGKPFTADAVFHLYFNKAGKLVRHDVDTDFFAVLARALDDPARAAEIMQAVGVAEESMLADPVEEEEEDGEEHEEAEREEEVPRQQVRPAPARLEPVDRIEQSKRARFAAVVTDDESEDDNPEETRGVVRVDTSTRSSAEPDAEPASAATPTTSGRAPAVDARLTMDFLLS